MAQSSRVGVWLRGALCRAAPSSFVGSCKEQGRPVTVLANGSRFLYVLDCEGQEELAVVRFSSTVQHVSCLQSLEMPSPVAVCCLQSGRIAAVSVEDVLVRAAAHTSLDGVSKAGVSATKATDDIFASLLENDGRNVAAKQTQGSFPRCALNGDEVSITIATCCGTRWSIQCAAILKDTLVLFTKDCKTGESLLTTLTPSTQTSLAGCTIPVFSATPSKYHVLSSPNVSLKSGSISPASLLHYRPSVAVVQCGLGKQATPSYPEVVPLEEDFYLQLFGPEYRLSCSSILLIGCLSGQILYCSVGELQQVVDGGLPLKQLYSLEEPVVSIHAPHLPREVSEQDALVGKTREVGGDRKANVLAFVGQKGRLVVSAVGYPAQSVASFAEFHVPGPILSSVLIPSQSLLYSTLRGVHEICLRSDCAQNSKPGVFEGRSPILIPELAFRFPNRVTRSGSFIIVHSNESQLVTMSPEGRLHTTKFDDDISSTPAPVEAGVAAQQLKQSLTAIQTNSEQLDGMRRRLSVANSSLVELGESLSLLCDVVKSENSTKVELRQEKGAFCCELDPTFEEVGVSMRKVCVDVTLHYDGPQQLGAGWSLVVQLHPYSNSQLLGSTTARGSGVSSRVLPLAALSSGNKVKTRIYLDGSLTPLRCTIVCCLHFSTAHLLSVLKPCELLLSQEMAVEPSNGVSLLLCSKTLDALDFMLQPQKEQKLLASSEREANDLFQGQKSSSQSSPRHPLHTLELPIPTQIATSTQQMGEHPTSLGITVLKTLIPVCERNPDIISTRTAAEVTLEAHNGSQVSLRVESPSSGVKLVIRASSQSMVTELCSCIQTRLTQVGDGVLDLSSRPLPHEELHQRLSTLQRFSRKVSSIMGDLARIESREEEEGRRELVAATYHLYSQLRQL